MSANTEKQKMESNALFAKKVIARKKTFIRDYSDKGRLPEVKKKIVEMAVNGSGVRDTARVLSISTATAAL
jgi:transposase-like protein